MFGWDTEWKPADATLSKENKAELSRRLQEVIDGETLKVANGTYEPIDKPGVRKRDPGAIAAARRVWCEWCGHPTADDSHVHHAKTKGSGGHDEATNLISLCYRCHDKVHRAQRGYEKNRIGRFLALRERLHRLHDGQIACEKCKVPRIPVWVSGDRRNYFQCSVCLLMLAA